MKYVSGRIVRGIYTWLGWSGEVAEPIGSRCQYGPLTYFIHLPMKMEPMSSETSAIRTQTPGNYPKRNKLQIITYYYYYYYYYYYNISLFEMLGCHNCYNEDCGLTRRDAAKPGRYLTPSFPIYFTNADITTQSFVFLITECESHITDITGSMSSSS